MLLKKCIMPLLAALVLSTAHAQPKPVNGVTANDIQALLAQSGELKCPGLADLRTLSTTDALYELYQRSRFAAQWQTQERLAALQQELAQLADDGLILADYGYALNANPAAEPCEELRISSEYLLALEHLSLGRLLQTGFEQQWQEPDALPAQVSVVVDLALKGLTDIQAAFDAARPALPLYRELRSAWRRMDKEPVELAEVPAGATIKPGRDDVRMPQLVRRLQAGGYLAEFRRFANPAESMRYEADIEQAVKNFQAAHGLEADGLVGVQTLAAMNVSPQQRLDQVRINLERLRWLDSQRSDYMVLVNVAGGDIRLYRGQQIIWQAKILSGRAERPTPALISRIDRITLNPGWTVPPTIFKEDKLPQIRRNPAFLQQNNLQVLDTQGRAIDPAQVNWDKPVGILLRQPPGPTNPLGEIALRFPSPYSVYLHDTPAQNLFENSARNVSSGCVRVQDIAGLTAHLLADKSEGELQQIALMQQSGKTHEIKLANGPQLIIAYWTAEAGKDGRIRYLRDPYNMDHLLISAFRELDTAYRIGTQHFMASRAVICAR